MTDQSRINPVIARKTRVAREDHQLRAMSPVKALRTALAKAADVSFGLALGVAVLEYRQVTVKDLADVIGSNGLLLLLDGPEGRRGAMHLDRHVLSSLIEVQTMGTVFASAPEERRITRTDAAIAAPLVDAILDRVEAQLVGEEEEWWMSGYRFGAMIEDLRSLCLALDAPDYHVFHANLDVAQGARAGQLTLVLPVCPRPMPAAAPDDAAQARPDETLALTVLDAPVALDAVLARIEMPLDRIWKLVPGECLPVSADQISRTELVVGGRHVVATVRLGRLNGARAVRLTGTHPSNGVDGRDARGPQNETAPDPNLNQGLAASANDAQDAAPVAKTTVVAVPDQLEAAGT